MKKLVANYFSPTETGIIPGKLEPADAIQFARAIRRHQVGLVKSSSVMMIDFKQITSRQEAFLQIIDTMRENLKETEFQKIWKSLYLELSLTSEIKNLPPFEPRFIERGEIAFRGKNGIFHVEHTPLDSIEMSHKKLRSIIKKLHSKIISEGQHLINESHFCIIHHSDTGVYWTREVQKEFSISGQTLIMLPLFMIDMWPKKSSEREVLLKIAKFSRSKMALIRVFKDRFFVYPTFDDQYESNNSFEFKSDGIAQYSDYAETTFGQDSPKVSDPKKKLKTAIAKEISKTCNRLHLSDALKSLIIENLKSKYIPSITYDHQGDKSFFSNNPNQPVSYSGPPLFYDLVTADKGTLIVFEMSFCVANSVDFFARKLQKNIQNALGKYLDGSAKVLFKNHDGPSGEKIFYNWGSSELNEKLLVLQKSLKKDFRSHIAKMDPKYFHKETDEKDFLDLFDLFVLVELDCDVSPTKLQEDTLSLSKEVTGRLLARIPKYGYEQGFQDGDLDTGNENFLVHSNDDDWLFTDYDDDE